MHFKRRPSSSAAHGYGSLRREGNKLSACSIQEGGCSGDAPSPVGSCGADLQKHDKGLAKTSSGKKANGGPRTEVWEQSFEMSSDVRYTRTPERVLKERRIQAARQTAPETVAQPRETARPQAIDPAPAVQERLLALQSKAASQEAQSAASRP